ncbi:glycerol dehydratase reactivase beta/small subunit family protein [Anaerosolibacter sp.]|uniref:glycerol dehydratase reactivase beta/small subunit family protein n=1 Tax=Anaerosolibacter sp. TaxID=1872527 RepID=UPI0039EE7945
MKINYGSQQPAIHIYYSSLGINPSLFNQMLFGMEEENVPYLVMSQEEKSALKLGYQAADDSSLGVGVGIGEDGTVILHYKRLKEEEPLFQIHLQRDMKKLRKLGANGARLVKGIPFKDLEEQETERVIQEEGITREDMALLIAKVMSKMKEIV